VTIKPVHHLSWTAKVSRFVDREFNSKGFLEGHHGFNCIEAAHPVEHRGILTLGWRKQAISLKFRSLIGGYGPTQSASAASPYSAMKYFSKRRFERSAPSSVRMTDFALLTGSSM